MAPPDGKLLSGLNILVTRPEYQQQDLVNLIEQEGGAAFCFPTLAIVPAEDQASLIKILSDLAQFDLAVFVSPNAASYTLRALTDNHLALPADLKLACVGKGCSRAVAQHGHRVDAIPVEGIGSEGLLQHELLNTVAGKHVIIFRGNGGRELLADTLRARGAKVEYCECYRRAIPSTDPGELIKAWRSGNIDIVTITSTQALRNLRTMLGNHADELLANTPLVVISSRIAETARQDGCQTVLVSEDTSDQSIVDCIKNWRKGQIPI